MHANIYARPPAIGIYRLGRQLDDGLAALLGDLRYSGLLNETLIVVMGEFGRTVGALSAQAGRDHHLQQFALFAGGGGGTVIGSTDPTGGFVANPGWSRHREIRTEDVEATIHELWG